MTRMIKSISFSQDELLSWIIRLYVPTGRFDVDATYSTGGFYRSGNVPKPALQYDISPTREDVIKADCSALPLCGASIDSLILDPPFLATKGPSLEKQKGNLINRRFSVCSSETELTALYQNAIQEAARILRPNGVLVFKCQDKVSSGKQYMMHCCVYQWALSAGFEPLDLFILLAKTRLIANWQRNQRHARKYHSYFWVFKKRRDALERDQPERLH